jgi:15-cis-phytoene desaturase
MVPKKVVILGGGVAGMSAAHELVERGFQVTVLERRAHPGGKARSMPVPYTTQSNVGGVYLGREVVNRRKDLPGEHGFRFFPGFYKHVVDTMQRIPYRNVQGDRQTVADNLVGT